ncbi:MAG: hypothetical protein KU28_01635 [Sulfurovum sp. PC08-66]|nr:MAG: hypothetical protein KU28_01635 [Sulfurovum sp. PC08-66]KIM12638.1 MAG: hypothetical protein KU37_01740 [Sulfuricurvum sp. PC08-66]
MSDKIAVIGAGPMGLAVAYQLALDGFKPVVYEADDRVGGMTATFDFAGQEIERYYHFHCTSDEAFFEVLGELGLSHKLRWTKTKMGYWFDGKVQAWGNPIALLRFKGLGWMAKFRYGIFAFLATKRNDWRPLERYDAMSWIRSWVGKEGYTKLWDKLLSLKFYEYRFNLSTPWMWSRVRRIGRSRYNLFQEKLGYLEGGSKTLLEAMKTKIESVGGEFRLSTPVSKIVFEEDNVVGIESRHGFEAYAKVISTIPLPIVTQIAPALKERFTNTDNIGVVCVIARLSKPLTQNFWLNTNDDSMDIPGIIEYGNLNPDVGHIVYVPYYVPQHNPIYSDSNEVFEEKIKRYFKRINPTLNDDDFETIAVHRYYYAQPICPPNYLDSLPDEQIAKGLWVADTTYYYPEDRGISESIGYGRAMARRVANAQ